MSHLLADSRMRNRVAKTAALFLIIVYILTSPSSAAAEFKKKVMVAPFQNPPNWSGSYNPGEWLADLVKNKIIAKGNYRIVAPAPAMKSDDGKVEEKPSVVSKEAVLPGQIIMRGQILSVKSSAQSSGKGKLEDYTELEAEVTLLDPKSNRVYAAKKIKVDARREKQSAAKPLSLDDPAFFESSLGVALDSLANGASALLNEVSRQMPFEADIIDVNEKKNEVVINIGSNDGVRPFDKFLVVFPLRYYRDPFSRVDLGDLFTQVGVIKTTDVQGNVARAQILAGAEIKTGNLVRAAIK